MKTIKLEDYMYKIFTMFWVDNLEKESGIIRKLIRELLLNSKIEIEDGNISISKAPSVNENIDKEVVNIPKYTVFYYKSNISDNGVETDYGLKSFRKLKDAEEEIKEIFYDKSDYAFLLKGLNSVIYRLVTKDTDGVSKPVFTNQEVGRDNKLYIQYYDND